MRCAVKVLVLQSELGVLRGGGENFTRNLFAAFAARGHHVSAAFIADRRARYPLALPPGIEPMPMRGWWSRKLGQATLSSISGCIPSESRLRAGWDRAQQAFCWRTIRWHNHRFQRRIEQAFAGRWGDFDLVFVHSDAILASKVARHRPTVLRLPGPVTGELVPMLRTVHAVCANGDALARLHELLGDEAIELPIGLDGQIFRPGSVSVRQALGWTEQHWVVGYVGRLAHLKGVDLLVNAFRDVARTVAGARLLLVGSGEYERKIRTMLAKEFARNLVHIQPDVNHEELPQWYRAMDVLVMPSRYENFSNALLEAMACGIPVLASDVGGNRVLSETGAGWLFEVESVPALSACLCGAAERRAELHSVGEMGARYARQRYSWAASAERLEKIITSQLGVRER
jgi:glycosyltransferase involved in cell wall biosynthesis